MKPRMFSKKEPKYKIFPEATIYDDDMQMYGVKIGVLKPTLTLKYTAWGTTPESALEAAEALLRKLEK